MPSSNLKGPVHGLDSMLQWAFHYFVESDTSVSLSGSYLQCVCFHVSRLPINSYAMFIQCFIQCRIGGCAFDVFSASCLRYLMFHVSAFRVEVS